MQTTEPARLQRLDSETDSYAFANGVLVYFDHQDQPVRHDRTVVIHGGADQRPVTIPGDLYGVIRAVALASGLSQDEAAQLVEAVEAYL